MKTFRVTAAGALLLSAASQVVAQPLGSRIDPTPPGAVKAPARINEETSARVMNTFARCVARQRRASAEALVALPYASKEQDRAARRMVGGGDDCMGDAPLELSFRAPLLVGGLAEQLIELHYGKADLAHLLNMSDEEQEQRGLGPRNSTEDLALCIVRRDPQAIRDLIAAPPAGDQEKMAVARLMPHLPPCVPADLTVNFNRAGLRALVATGLYRALAFDTHKGAPQRSHHERGQDAR